MSKIRPTDEKLDMQQLTKYFQTPTICSSLRGTYVYYLYGLCTRYVDVVGSLSCRHIHIRRLQVVFLPSNSTHVVVWYTKLLVQIVHVCLKWSAPQLFFLHDATKDLMLHTHNHLQYLLNEFKFIGNGEELHDMWLIHRLRL